MPESPGNGSDRSSLPRPKPDRNGEIFRWAWRGAILLGILGICSGLFTGLVASGIAWHSNHDFTTPLVMQFGTIGVLGGACIGALLRLALSRFRRGNGEKESPEG